MIQMNIFIPCHLKTVINMTEFLQIALVIVNHNSKIKKNETTFKIAFLYYYFDELICFCATKKDE